MPRGNWTHGELGQLTKIQLRDILRDEFKDDVSSQLNSLMISDLMARIMACQEERQKQALPEPAPAGAQTRRGRTDAPRPAGQVTVACGAASGTYPVAGKTAGEVRDTLRDVLNIDDSFEVRVNGTTVLPTHVLEAGNMLEFVKPAGTKAL